MRLIFENRGPGAARDCIGRDMLVVLFSKMAAEELTSSLVVLT